jgi:hypothetical protein
VARLVPFIGLVGFTLGIAARAADASNITPISQSRSVSAQASVEDFSAGEIDSDSDSDSAADFGLFDTVVFAHATLHGVEASAQASQGSGFSVDPIGPGSEGIFAHGDAGSNAAWGASEFGSSQARSDFSITFALAQPASYQLPWSLANLYGFYSSGIASFTLRGGPNDEIIARFQWSGEGSIGSVYTGVLPPGDYLIEAHAEAQSLFSPEEASSSFGVDLYLVPYVPGVIALMPALSLNAPGGDHTVTATVRDQFNIPSEDVEVTFEVASGPNGGASGTCTDGMGGANPNCRTDADGVVNFTYDDTGGPGVDSIFASFEDLSAGTVFSNTVLKFWDADCNQNDIPDSCDLDCAGFGNRCGEYADCGMSSDANDDGHPDECNAAPDCTNAGAEPDELWPPNLQFEEIAIAGVTDPDGDPTEVTIDSIHQDEQVGINGPDASGVGEDVASVRAERAGQGDGRVYTIAFTADDGMGDQCSGEVTVCVPRDMAGQHEGCVDGGSIFDSTEQGSGSAAASASSWP